ncbi:MAG: sulfatase-like hydrolase/transferase [Saprospiraceae bacterium]|nr:sulfatase-like hydrolase/transferase [Saprospiraceae bacterium]
MEGREVRDWVTLKWLVWMLASNIILFVPITIAYQAVAGWTPIGGILNLDVEGRLSALFLNHNYNPFRLLAEWSILFSLAAFIQRYLRHKAIVVWSSTATYILIFSFQCYYAIMMGIYGEPPYIQNEWSLVQEVLPVFLAGNGISFPLVLICTVIILGILFWMCMKAFRMALASGELALSQRSGQIWTCGILFYILVSQLRYHHADIHDLRLNSQWLTPRILDALALDKLDPFDHILARSDVYASWSRDSLVHRPNIYLIFIESYGAVPFLSEYIREPFQERMTIREERMKEQGWTGRSTYSLAPIKGGRSWLSFSSALMGIHIADQITYNQLFDLSFTYPHLVRYLNAHGYTTHRINTMRTDEKIDAMIPYEAVATFHEFDDWVLFPDIPYTGFPFNSMGGIPDQFALEYVWDSRIRGADTPQMVFFITLDSHTPWYPPPLVRSDFRALNDIKTNPYPDSAMEADIMDRYLACVEYEWDFLEQFITHKANKDDLFILIGDHQPPAMEHQIWDQINDYAVPLHVISKGNRVDSLLSILDFAPGLTPPVQDSIHWHHEGVYSLIRYLLEPQNGPPGTTARVFQKGI